MNNLMKKIINLPRRTIYQIKHIYWVVKIAKKHFGYVPLQFYKHDLDKIFLLRDKKIHSHRACHHIQFLLKNENEITNNNIKEMICDWECARFFKPDKPLSARQYFEIVKQKYEIPKWFEILIQYNLDNYNF